MQCILNVKKSYDKAFIYLLDKLPTRIKNGLLSFLVDKSIYSINEIRLKASSYIALITNQKNIVTNVYIEQDLIDETVLMLCNGSIYAHISTIKEGYISVGKGIRAGICGRAVIDNEIISGIYDISSINIRIPQHISSAGRYIFDILQENSFLSSLLLYSPPGVGKTTILRDLVVRLSSHGIRHAVIDTREEITPFLTEHISSDVFLSYPKGKAIEIATKSMTPQIIICDEITSLQESQAIKQSVNSGVTLVATTHASSFEELKNKEILSPLFNGQVFNYAIGVSRQSNRYDYEVNKL